MDSRNDLLTVDDACAIYVHSAHRDVFWINHGLLKWDSHWVYSLFTKPWHCFCDSWLHSEQMDTGQKTHRRSRKSNRLPEKEEWEKVSSWRFPKIENIFLSLPQKPCYLAELWNEVACSAHLFNYFLLCCMEHSWTLWMIPSKEMSNYIFKVLPL